MPRRLLNLVVLIPFALTLRANTAPAATDFAAGPTKAALPLRLPRPLRTGAPLRPHQVPRRCRPDGAV